MRPFLYLNYCLLLVCISIFALFGFLLFAPKIECATMQSIISAEYKHIDRKWPNSEKLLTTSSFTPLKLESAPYTLTLPDLREEILYYGKNIRPDLKEGKSLFFIGLKNQEEVITIEENKPLYLAYTPTILSVEYPQLGGTPFWGDSKDAPQGVYSFSPNNQPTALSIELRNVKHEGQVHVKLLLIDENKVEIKGEEALASFCLNLKNLSKASSWELNKHRVDGTLLVRQKARFTGEDLFLQMHGGEEYAALHGHFRIDFLGSELPYSCFVQEGDFLIWENEKWIVVDSRMVTHNKPLLVVKKIEERMINFELWNEIGNQKISLNLMRLRDHQPLPPIDTEFHFIQAKTWTQFIVECRGEKMTLRPNDWLLLTEEGWQLLDSVEKIDSYVAHIIQGPLFVVGKLKKEEGGQVLSGHLFNTMRSEVTEVKLEQKKQLLSRQEATKPVHSLLGRREASLAAETTSHKEIYNEN